MANIFIISAPSGCGKTSLIKALIQSIKQINISISHTTRAPRPNEVDGKNYFFINKQQFNTLKNDNQFVEYAKVFDNYYGSTKQVVENLLKQNKDIIFEIDWQGTQQIKKKFPSAISIFILPPSNSILKQRLIDRKQDYMNIIEKRMQKAHDEIQHYKEYDYLLINNNFNTTVKELSCIVKCAHLAIKQQTNKHKNLIKKLLTKKY